VGNEHAAVYWYGFQLTYLTCQVIVSQQDKDFDCPVYLISRVTQTKQSSHFGIFSWQIEKVQFVLFTTKKPKNRVGTGNMSNVLTFITGTMK